MVHFDDCVLRDGRVVNTELVVVIGLFVADVGVTVCPFVIDEVVVSPVGLE